MNEEGFHPGPPSVTPQQRLLMMDDNSWEEFIESCVNQLKSEGVYTHVQKLGGAGDKGRDVCGYTDNLAKEGTWDLYQAKYYGNPLRPSQFLPELAKLLTNIQNGSYSRPRAYFICASRNVGTSLFDYLLNPERLRTWLLAEWKKKNGDFGKFNSELSPALEEFVLNFPFEIIKPKSPAELLDIHSRNGALHWQTFGSLPLREEDPPVPAMPAVEEEKYIGELIKIYEEHLKRDDLTIGTLPTLLGGHLVAQRRLFYSAEGLNRFSRDKLPGAFDKLLDEVETGIGSVVHTPYPTGLDRLTATLAMANNLQIKTNPLSARLQAADLQGSCHHLVNQSRLMWILDDTDE